MKLNSQELAFLSAWAREEKTANPYVLPAHQFQAVHQVSSVALIRIIKAWARSEGRRDEDIFQLDDGSNPPWPWATEHELIERLNEAGSEMVATGGTDRASSP